MSLSDLDLVQQAMAPTEPGAQNGSNGTANAAAPGGDDHLAELGIDISKLSEGDRAAVQPILDALKAASKDGEGEDVDVEGILKQLDAADGAADALESRLDNLLENLGAMERDAEQECEKVEKDKEIAKKE